MKEITLKSLALEINISVDLLIKQFASAGIKKSASDYIDYKEKEILLSYLRSNKNMESNKLTLKRKIHSVINVANINGKNKSIHVEIRKNYTYLQKNLQENSKEHSQNINQKKEENSIEKLRNLENFVKNDDIKPKNEINEEDNIFKDKTKIKNINKTSKNQKINIEKKHNYKNLTDINNKRVLSNDSLKYSYLQSMQQIIVNKKENIRNVKSKNKSNNITKHKKFNEKSKFIEKNIYYKKKNSVLKQIFQKPVNNIIKEIVIGETINVSNLANKMAIKVSELIKEFMQIGIIANINQVVDQKTAKYIIEKMGHKAILRKENDIEESLLCREKELNKFKEKRPPIVTIMGHVDHGKTSILDCIRSSNISNKEIGGITQKISAYYVKTNIGDITFLDTPGHVAFFSMRQRGIDITDIIVLVIAVDDGIMQQTIEIIKYAQKINVPIIIAINKIDKSKSNINRIKTELASYEIVPDDWGGETQFINVSAKSGEGIQNLIEAILLQSEMLELNASRKVTARGIILESKIDKGIGPIAHVIILEGNLKKGDIVLCGMEYGRVRAIHNEYSKNLNQVFPSMPATILGLSGVPNIGDEIFVVKNEKKAREVAYYRRLKFKEEKNKKQKQININLDLSQNTNKTDNLKLIIKYDTQGSIEAIKYSFQELSLKNKKKIHIIYSGIGNITEADVTSATSNQAHLIGFNVNIDKNARKIINSEKLNFKCYYVIYDLIKSVDNMLIELNLPKIQNRVIGSAKVVNIFKSSKFGTIAGCIVTDGIIKCKSKIKVLRNKQLCHEGEIESLKRFKDNINEVSTGMECGISVKNYNIIQPGDIIESIIVEKINK